ncbi:MAG: RHS repeat-associated core domain-containing protein [Planctomycetota bacterium]
MPLAEEPAYYLPMALVRLTPYDNADRVTLLANLKNDGTTISSLPTPSMPPDGRPMLPVSGDRVTWTYDNAGRLENEKRRLATNAYNVTHVNAYDACGNQTVKIADSNRTTYTYDNANQLTNAQNGGVTTFYDGNGNRVSEIAPGCVTMTFTWDYENRRTQAQDSLNVTYEEHFEPDGKRIREKLIIGGVEQYVRKHVWDLDNVLLETNGSNVTQAIFTTEPAGIGNLISRRASNTLYYHFDALGSTSTTTNASQSVVNEYLYTAYGEAVAGSATLDQPFTFVGQKTYYSPAQPDSIYVRARWYQSTSAVWYSMPPASRPTGENGYIYAKRDPVNRTEPSGLPGCCCLHCICGRD